MTTLVLTIALAIVSVLGMAFAGKQSPWLQQVLGAVVLAGTACAVLATLFDDDVPDDWMPQLTMFAGVLAVGGGHLVTRAVLDVVDESGELGAEALLPGGSWIGALERLAFFVSLVAGLPEGVAVVLAVKALGRYPELKIHQQRSDDGSTDRASVGERFIIGTMVSLLWAAACGYVVVAQGGTALVLR